MPIASTLHSALFGVRHIKFLYLNVTAADGNGCFYFLVHNVLLYRAAAVSACAALGFSYNKLGFEHDLIDLAVGLLRRYHLRKHLHAVRADLVIRLRDCRQRIVQILIVCDVVISNDADLVRNAVAAGACGAERADRDDIRRTEHAERRSAQLHDPLKGAVAILELQIVVKDMIFRKRDALCAVSLFSVLIRV